MAPGRRLLLDASLPYLQGSVAWQWIYTAGLPVSAPHRAFTWSRLNIWGSLGATLKWWLIAKWCWGQIRWGRSESAVGIILAVVGCMLTKNGMCHTSRLTCVVRSSETTPQSAAQEQHDAAADHHKRRKDHRQAHSVASIYVVWLNLCTEQNGIAEECIFLGDLSNSKKYRGTNWLVGLHNNITKNLWRAFLSKVVNS